MSKKLLSLVILAIVAAPVCAETTQPLVKLGLASYNKVQMDVGAVGFVQQSPEMPTWLSSLFQLYAEGSDLRGIDRSRPWGAVVQRGEGMSAYGFVPVRDAETLAWELDEFIANREEVSPGIYRVQGREPGKELYAKESQGWLFVSDRAESLTSTPWDPAKELGEMNSQYDVAIRLQLNNVPAEAGRKILTELDMIVGPALRRMASDQTVDVLGQMAMHLDEVTLGWAKR
jgi:hypothetical protein